MTEVAPNFKPELGPCACGCPVVARPQARKRKDGLHHARGCKCVRCNGAKIRSGGQAGQRSAAKRAGVKKIGSFYAGHEEMMDGPTRIEIKTGAQIKPMVTAYDKHKAQSDAARRIGDTRPFVLHVLPLPHGKRQLTTFESNSDDEYKAVVYALAVHCGLIEP
jgi:hypothetical protein